jgi:phosphoglycolate phosphatase-like HAD superfamily hydrolase
MNSGTPRKPIVIVDMDGTLADVRHRLHYIKGPGKEDWKRFFQAQSHDQPFAAIAQRVRVLARDHQIVIVTGRPEEYRSGTEEWLRKWRIPFSRIYMRAAGDHRPDYVIKGEILKKIGPERVVLAFEDRQPICEVYRQAGVRVVAVNHGEENREINEEYRRVS